MFGDADPCTQLEARLRSELGDRRDWWLLSDAQVRFHEQSGAVVSWKFPHGTYEAWLVADVWNVKLPGGEIILVRRWLLQQSLWRLILRSQQSEADGSDGIDGSERPRRRSRRHTNGTH
jgi:hypothetical protein